MKTDKKVLSALILIILLIVFLVMLTIDNRRENDIQNKEIRQLSETNFQLKTELEERHVINGKDGKTPIKGVDYFDGANGKDGARGTQGPKGDQGAAGPKGETGEKGEKGDAGERGASIDLKCIGGVVSKKYATDSFWKMTNIRCEATDE